jgi:hypothetical protein
MKKERAMNETGEESEKSLKSPQREVELHGLSRREFLARLGKGSAAVAFSAYAPIALLPSSVRAESQLTKSADELIYASATTLAKAIREKQVSSEEVVNAYLRRIAAVNPQLNAVVQLTAETALQQAREADAALARGESKGPLHGVPFTVKDTIETAGVICTSGTRGRASFVPTQDATTVARLRAAGAILLGKTNVSELGLGFETDNLVYGRTNNPYDLSCNLAAALEVRLLLLPQAGHPWAWAVPGSVPPPTVAGSPPSHRLHYACPEPAIFRHLSARPQTCFR